MDNINIGLRCYTIILLISTLSFIAGSNVNCNGKAFHCVNSTHFKICVDLGHGVSTTVDEFLIPCPQNTVCKHYNLFECEYELTTTIPPVTIQSEVTNEQIKTIDTFPTKQPDGRELSEKYYNKLNATPASLTESFLTDAVIDSVNTSNANDLDSSSNGDINKTLNISRSTDKELTSITESGIDVTQSLYNINTLVADIGVSSKYNTETPLLFSTTQDRKTIVSFKSKTLEPFNQNNLDFDESYTVTNRANQVSSMSEMRYSTATLLPGNFTDPSLQENTPGITNINHLIKSDNTSQNNLDILIKYNATQLNNSDNNTQYSNIKNSMYSKNTSTDINTLNSNPFNVITDEILTSDVSDINKRSNVNSVIMFKPSGQHLAEIKTASTIVVPGTTNQFSSHIPLNTEVIETFFNDGFNITTSLEKLSLSDGDISSTSFIPEISVAEINDMSTQITKSSLNYGVSSVALTKHILDEKNTSSSNKLQTSSTKSSKYGSESEIFELRNEFEAKFSAKINSVNNSQYLTTTDLYFHERSDIPMSSASKSEVTSPIHVDKVIPLRSKGTSQVNNALLITNVTTMDSELVSIKTPEIQSNSSFLPNFSLFTTAATKTTTNDRILVGDYSFTSVDVLPVLTTGEMSNEATSLKPLPDLISESKPWTESDILIDGTGLDNNNISITEESNNMTWEISKANTSLKSISDLIPKNETRPKSVIVTIAAGLDNNHITTTEESSNITEDFLDRVTSLKPISDLISKNETPIRPVMATVATDLDKNNITTTEEISNITAELSNGVTSLKPISDLISKNETPLKPVIVTVATDFDENNISTTEASSNITVELSSGVTSLKPISDLISKNETRLKPGMVTVATHFDKNNISTTEASSNIAAELSNGVTSLKPISDLISKNENRLKPGMVTVATDFDKNNISTTEASSNITAELSNGITSLKPISDVISKNETRLKPGMVTVATDSHKNNISTTEASSNITAELSNGVTSLKPISDLISKNESRLKPVMVTVATYLDKSNISTTEESSNITVEISNGVTSLKPISDLFSKNGTRLKPGTVTVVTDFNKNNISTTEASSNITAELSNGVTRLKPISDLILTNESRLKPVMVTVAMYLDKSNISTTEESSNITVELSNGVTSLKPISDLISKNESRLKPVMVTVATYLDKNNISTTEASSNITAELSNGVTRLKPISDLILTNESRLKPVMVTVATYLDKSNISTTEESSNITVELSNGVTSLKPISDLISKNESRLKPVMVTVATYLDKNNISTTEASSNITAELSNGVTSLKPISDLISKNETLLKPVMVTVATDLHHNNVTTTGESNNTIAEISNGVTNLISISDLISKNETSPKPIMVTVASNTFDSFHKENIFKTTSSIFQQSLDESTSSLSSRPNILKTEHFNKDSVGPISSTDSVIIDLERNTTWIINNLPKNGDKPSTLTDKSSGVLDNNNTTHNNDTTKPIINPFYEINKVLSKNLSEYIYKNISDVYQTTTESDRAFIAGPTIFESPNSMNVTNNTFILIDVLSEHRAVSDINKNIEKPSQLESNIITKPLTYFDSNKSSIHVISSHTKNVTTLSSQSAKNEMNTKQAIYNNTNQSQILGESSFVNSNLTKSIPENILILKLVTSNIFNLSTAFNITYINNNITDKNNNSLKDVEIEHHQVTNHLVEKLLPVGVINTYLNYPDKNVVPSVSNNSKSVPLIYLNNSLVKPPLTDIYSVNKTASNKNQETEIKDSSQTNKNEHVRNKTEYLLLNPYTQVNATAINVNDKSNSITTIKSVNTNNCTNCSKLSEISNSQLSGNVIKPLLILQEPLQEVKNTSNLHPESDNLFSEDILNNWGIDNKTLVANDMKPTQTFTHEENVSEVNNFTFVRSTKKYINELNTSSESNITTNNLLRKTSSQTNTIKNMTYDGMSSNGHQVSKEFDKSSTGPLKMEKNHFVSDRTKLEIIKQQEKFTISDQLNTNQSNRIEKKQLTNGHGHSESNLTIANGVTKNIRNINYPNTDYGNLQTNQVFRCTKRGKFSDLKDCNKFFICIGRVQPIIGVCPTDSVFSEYLKQCTKNVTHCIRNNEFKCTAAGRFINILCNNTYFVCAKKKSSFVRFTFKCQRGYYLDKNNIKCTPELKNTSKPDENSSKNTKELSFDNSKEMEGVSINSKNVFECEKEGKFQNSQDCRKYYECKKGRKSIYRRKIKQCDSDEVFHKQKKKCVDVESYECDI